VHIRLKDWPIFPHGDEHGTMFKKVADRIVVGELNVTSGGGGKTIVLIGRSNSNTKMSFSIVCKCKLVCNHRE
jgi:hypothetical protein